MSQDQTETKIDQGRLKERRFFFEVSEIETGFFLCVCVCEFNDRVLIRNSLQPKKKKRNTIDLEFD